VIDLANLNVHLDIPVVNKAGRGGMNFTYDLNYDSSVWYPVGASGSQVWTPVSNWGWRGVTEIETGYVSYSSVTTPWCLHAGEYYGQQITDSNWVYHDQFGISHPFIGEVIITEGAPAYCNGSTTNLHATSADGSGAVLTTSGGNGVITYTNGQVVTAPINTTAGAASMTDRNGNIISVNSSGVFTDTLNVSALTAAGSGTAASPVTFTYKAPSGASPEYKMNYTAYNIKTNFGCTGITEYSASGVYLVSSISLPDGTAYTFNYEKTPGNSGYYTGRFASVQLPTGGTITYTYTGGSSGNITCADGSASGFTRKLTDGGSWSATWTYNRVMGTQPASATIATAPQLSYNSAANQTIIQFQGIYETQRDIYQGSGPTITSLPISESTLQTSNLLQEIQTCYNTNTTNCPITAIALPITQRNVFDLLSGSSKLIDQHIYKYDGYGNVLERDDYDYGSSAYGALLGKTVVTYASLGDITAFRQTVTVTNGVGTTVSQTNYNYDQTAVVVTSGTPQHTSITGSRGNLTSINLYTSGSTYLTQTNTYFDTGNVQTATDVNSAATTYAYGACGNSFPTTVTEPLSMSRTYAWDSSCLGGVLSSVKDENGNTTTVSYTDPDFWRPASISYPDGGQTSWAYNSSTSLTTSVKLNSSQTYVTTTLLDGLGRTTQQQVSVPQGTLYTVTAYDQLGRKYTVSNPYLTTSDPTYGLTTYQYDALSRPTMVIPPDGTASSNNVSVAYTNNCATSADQAGKSRSTCSNSISNLTQVFENPTGVNYETDYTSDPLGNILTVNQKGGNANSAYWRTRTYTYDFLSRLTQSSDPESGAIKYNYDAGGNQGALTSRVAPLPNQTGSSTVTTTYTYDALHRLLQRSYSDGLTPTVYFVYDENDVWFSTTNNLGRLSEAYEQIPNLVGSVFSYDTMGRIIVNNQCMPVECPSAGVPVSYTYDLAGDITSYVDAGVTLTLSYDSARRPLCITSNYVDSQHPAALVTVDSSIGYYPQGARRKLTYGNGLLATAAFNNTLEPCRINLNSSATALGTCADAVPSGNLLDLTAGFSAGSSNNGNVASLVAVGQQTFNRTYTYDSLNRLSTMADSASGQSCKGLTWVYDAWGNVTNQNNTGGSCYTFYNAVAANNQLSSPYRNDAAGNLTYDTTNTYYYDAENRLIQVNGTLGTCSTASACYTYDALGHRVHKSGTSIPLAVDYMYDLSGNVMAEYEPACSGGTECNSADYIYLAGKLIAEYVNDTTYFSVSDHLSSTRILTGMNQAVVQNLDYYPYGSLNSTDSGITTHKFTGDERDAETGLDHTEFRKYSSSLLRWLTPDPAGMAAVNPANPQSWNRYAYVLNNPLGSVDPTGQDGCNAWNVSWEGSGIPFPCLSDLTSGNQATDSGDPTATPPPQCGAVPQYCVTNSVTGPPPLPGSTPSTFTQTMLVGRTSVDNSFTGCSGLSGTANIETNCGYQFGQGTSQTPIWYLNEANLNGPTNIPLTTNMYVPPGATQAAGWQGIFQIFGITNLTGPTVPNYFQKTPCYGQLQNLTPSKINQMGPTCSGL
jgi:RHS repeat-associated protein